MTSPSFVEPDAIRAMFSDAMSNMYRAEVPLYGDLIAIVDDANRAVLARDPALEAVAGRSPDLAGTTIPALDRPLAEGNRAVGRIEVWASDHDLPGERIGPATEAAGPARRPSRRSPRPVPR